MRIPRFLLTAATALALLACGERADAPGAAPDEAIEPVGVIASDNLPGLAAAPTGIDFWVHPNVAFNSLMIVASDEGLVSYNIEDGNEVSRVPGVAFDGAAVSYIGFGPLAAGIAAAYDVNESAFRFYGVDNASRLFLPLGGGPAIRGAVRGFCMGRARRNGDPTLFVVQKGEMQIFNLTPDMNGGEAGIAVSGESGLAIPETATACAVDADGVAVIATEDGEIYRLDGEMSFASPFVRAGARAISDVAVFSPAPEGAPATGWIAALDPASATVRLFDSADGRADGAVRIEASLDLEAVPSALTMGASAANLGGLYRNGVIALGVAGEDAFSIRLIPFNGAVNALGLEAQNAADPRGAPPAAPPEDQLIITPDAPAPVDDAQADAE